MRTNIITTIPRPMSLVKFNYKAWTSDKERAQYIPQYKKIFGNGAWVFIGELTNMPRYGVYANQRTGTLITGYRIDNFIEVNK